MCLGIEILLLGIVAVRGACAVVAEFGYLLYPLNPPRLFVAKAVICTCFEMGNPKSAVFGADPETQSPTGRKLRILLVSS